jgi:Uma2 family endonuclease
MLMVSKTHGWTVDELDRLPDDGNRYEIVDGELFVTPAPSRRHQLVSASFFRRVDAFVAGNGLGRTFFAPGDVQSDTGNRVQPDIFVEPRSARGAPANWIDAPKPILVIEILSDSRDRVAWQPPGVAQALVVELAELFGDVLDGR